MIDPNNPYFAHVIALVAAASGGFFGSLSAFILAVLQEKNKRRTEQHRALLRTQFVLASQMNTLLCIRVQHLDPLRDDPQRFSKLVTFFYGACHLTVDFERLDFLAEIKEPGLMQDIYLAERSYFTALETIKTRDEQTEKVLYGADIKVHDFDFETGKSRITADAREIRRIKALTDCLYTSVDDAIKLAEKSIKDLHDIIKKSFKKKVALKFESLESNKPLHSTSTAETAPSL